VSSQLAAMKPAPTRSPGAPPSADAPFALCRCAGCDREMKILPAWAGKMVRCPYCKQPTQAYRNCRVYERRPCAVEVACQPAAARTADEARWEATVCDISRGGVRLRLGRRFEKGAALAVELPGPAGEDPTVVFVRVARLTRAADGAWLLGCAFISELSEEEVRNILAAASAGA